MIDDDIVVAVVVMESVFFCLFPDWVIDDDDVVVVVVVMEIVFFCLLLDWAFYGDAIDFDFSLPQLLLVMATLNGEVIDFCSYRCWKHAVRDPQGRSQHGGDDFQKDCV